MVTPDETLLFQIINMLIFMYFLNRMLYSPVKRILRERAAKLQGMHDEVDGYEQRAAERRKEVDAKMAAASTKAKAALDHARDEAQKAGDARLSAIREESEAMKKEQLAALASEVDAARSTLDAGIEGFAKEMAGKILGREI